jgi:hypothetical protein
VRRFLSIGAEVLDADHPFAAVNLPRRITRLRRILVAQGVQRRDSGSKSPESGEYWMNAVVAGVDGLDVSQPTSLCAAPRRKRECPSEAG